MKFQGINKLKKNDYSNIIISSDGIKVTGGSNIPTIEGESIFDNICGLSCEEITKLVVEYFLKYHKINFIDENYQDEYGKIISSDGISLTYEKPLYADLSDEILDKYLYDREYFLLNSNKNNYLITTAVKETSYRENEEENVFNLSLDNKYKLCYFEKLFFIKLILNIFDGELINIYYNVRDFVNINDLVLYSNNHSVRFDVSYLESDIDVLLNFIKQYIVEHNDEIIVKGRMDYYER